jgi:methyltransferase-like protein/ubiquinone/menaquinone biosynthesis C-methylase UbiE
MENPYNQVPYHSAPFPQAHISRLATMASLLGVSPPDVTACRVLELGCNDGSHLIPMAMEFPESQFVGIDLAEHPIARATDTAAELGLDNVNFRAADVMQLGGQPGECDYLVAHGLYSWVPQPVQDKILELCSRLLAPSGVAYISYNCYPAWHVREMTRNMVRIHTAGMTDPVEIRNRAISLLAAIYRSESEQEPYREAVRAEMERIIAKDATLCFHDDFGEHNLPVYFSEFVHRANAHGLQFISEADPTDFHHADFAADTRESLAQMQDPVEREQFFDFLALRGFRRTLLCRDDLVLDRTLPVERLRSLHYSAALKGTPDGPDLAGFTPTEFTAPNGSSVTVNQPFVKVVLHELSRAWPASLTFDQLLEKARAAAPLLNTTDAEMMLREVLLRMHMPGLLEVSVLPYRYSSMVSATPQASKLARFQIRNGPRVTSLRHRSVEIDHPAGRVLLPLLDGTRDIGALQSVLATSNGALERSEIEAGLERLRELALLES